MSRFRKVDGGTWGDRRFKDLTQDAKLLWFYLLTGPEVTSLPGLIVIGRPGLAEALGWSLRRLDKAISELTSFDENHARPMVVADWKSRLVWLPSGKKYNRPANPSVVRGWRDHWRCTPECSLKEDARADLAAYCASLGPEYAKAFAEIVSDDEVPVVPPDPPSHPPSSPSLSPPSCQTSSPPLSLARTRTATAPVTAPDTALSEGVQGEPAGGVPPDRPSAPVPTGQWRVPKSETRLARDEWIRAYTAGVIAGSGDAGWSFRPQAFATLERVVSARCPPEARANIAAWLEPAVEAFVRATKDRAGRWSSFSADGFENWWNAGRPGLQALPRRLPPLEPDPPGEPLTPEEQAEIDKILQRHPRPAEARSA